ncbi:MAG TPA: tripartite tricarboxylate transporter substrate binding protein [Burkholderiales bacterium]|nr:tripartite tricarboxylate transporter substrate binding protein [Burkholderiales bacterium]
MSSRSSASAALGALVLTLASVAASAQAYPSRAVRAIVPFAPGGGTDFIARVVMQKLSEAWGQPVVVENRPGGTTLVASDLVAKSAPDGYTLLVTPVPFSIVPNLARLPFNPMSDFEHIALFNLAPLVFIVHPGVPAKNPKELVALARARPGALNFGSSGTGSSNHLAGELFNAMAGVKIVHVPYKGSAPSLADLAGGHVDIVVSTLTSAVPLITSGKVRPIAVTSLERSPEWPQIPTMGESGLKGFQAEGWNGVSAPARTPASVVEKINADVAKALLSPDVAEKFRREGAAPKRVTPPEFAAFIRAEIAKWGKVIKFAKVDPL